MSRTLVDDCFQYDDVRLTHGAAVAALSARVVPVAGRETVPLTSALGRILAVPVSAEIPVPNHTNAAVDGYAFAHAALAEAAEGTLLLAGRAAAGHPLAEGASVSGKAVRIFTGAMLPAGVDTVAMQEDCSVEIAADGTTQVAIPKGLKRGANVRKAGEDVAAGSRLIDPGQVLRPQDLAALASIGRNSVECFMRLRVALVSTGDEIRRPNGRPLPAGQVFDANVPLLSGLLSCGGYDVTDLGVWPDNADVVRANLAKAAKAYDVILTTGGASRGEEDHMAAALAANGSRHFWQIAVKPGRPMMFGQVGQTVVVGLPGNPVAVFVCTLMYVWPLLRKLAGGAWVEPRRFVLPAAFQFLKRKPGRREFWRGYLQQTPQGLVVEKFERDGSGLISGLRAADGLIDIPEDRGDIHIGDLVAYIPFSEFGIVSC
jgi:molybdopterin molybdotransferase